MTELRTATLWNEDSPAFGGWLTIASPLVLEGLVNAGSDYVGIDCQHTMIDENDSCALLRPLVGTEVAKYVRVTSNDPARIGLVLDAGADGVIVPMVSTPEEAAAAVAASRYPPRGVRSFGPQHKLISGTPSRIESLAHVFVMIETAEGVENVEEICATEGLAGTYIGPVDLAIGLGIEDPFEDPAPSELVEAIRRIREASTAAGIVAGIHATSAERAAGLADDGFRMLSLRADFLQLADGVKRDLDRVRGVESLDGPARLYS